MAEVSSAELGVLQGSLSERQRMLFMAQYGAEKKDRSVALILAVVIGWMGVDRFYVGDVGMGALKLLTGGLCGILWLVDLFGIMQRVDRYNRDKAHAIVASLNASTAGTDAQEPDLKWP